MMSRLFLEKHEVSPVRCGELGQLLGVMRVVSQYDSRLTQFGKDEFVLPTFIFGGMVTVVDEEIDLWDGLERFKRISVKDLPHGAIGLSEKKTGIRVDVSSVILSGVAFAPISEKRRAKHAGPNAKVNSSLNDDAGSKDSHENIPANPPSEFTAIRTTSIATRGNARQEMSLEFSIFEDFRHIRGCFSKRYACNRSNSMRKVGDIAISQRIGEVIDLTGAEAPDQHLRQRTAEVAHRSPRSQWDQAYPSDRSLQKKSFQ